MFGGRTNRFWSLVWFTLFVLKTRESIAVPATGTNQTDANWNNCTTPTTQVCPANWWYHDMTPSCLLLSPVRRTFAESRDFCRSFAGADVAVSFNTYMSQFISENMMVQGFREVWLALRHDPVANKWSWSYGNVHLKQSSYRQWKIAAKKQSYEHCSLLVNSKENYNPEGEWKYEFCGFPHYFVCQQDTIGSTPCPDNWTEIIQNKCVKPFSRNMTYDLAADACTRHNSHLLQIDSDEMAQAMNEFFRPFHTSWFGITQNEVDKGKPKNWRWISGHEITVPYDWGSHEPKADPDKNCAVISLEGEWAAADCNAKNQVVCVQEELRGPGNTSMTINFHRSDQAFYLDEQANVTCTTIGSHIHWVLELGGNIQLDPSRITQKDEIVRSSRGLCVTKVTSTLSLPTQTLYKDVRLTCQSTLLNHCERPSDTLRLCDTRVFSVVEGPKGPPQMTYNYTGFPGPVPSGAIVTVTCFVPAGRRGTLMWVLHSLNKAYILKHDNPLVKTYDRTSNGDINSELEIELQYSKTGTTISCFAYDAGLYTEDQICLFTDRYCATTPSLRAEKDKIKKYGGGPMLSYPHLALFLAVLAMLILLAVFKKTVESVGQRDEDLALDLCDAPKVASDSSLNLDKQQGQPDVNEQVTPVTPDSPEKVVDRISAGSNVDRKSAGKVQDRLSTGSAVDATRPGSGNAKLSIGSVV